MSLLTITRKQDERTLIGSDIILTVLVIEPNRVHYSLGVKGKLFPDCIEYGTRLIIKEGCEVFFSRKGGNVRLHFDAEPEIAILRENLYEKIRAESVSSLHPVLWSGDFFG